jgi:hypothetical protein
MEDVKVPNEALTMMATGLLPYNPDIEPLIINNESPGSGGKNT